jgi:hypothetical protein
MQGTSAETKTVAVPKALLEKSLDRVDELEAELQEYRDHNERDKAKIRRQVTEAVEGSERSESDQEQGKGRVCSQLNGWRSLVRIVRLWRM